MLTARVLGAHVDDALEIEQRAHGRGRHPMLAGAGLGDDPPLAHPLGQQRLAERVVELVRARVVEILALEIHAAPGVRRQPARAIQRRRAPSEVAQQPVQLATIRRILASLHPRMLQLGEGGHQRLWDILPAVAAEAVLDRGRAHTGTAAEVACTAAKKARSFASSLCPGARSVPLAVSTA